MAKILLNVIVRIMQKSCKIRLFFHFLIFQIVSDVSMDVDKMFMK